MKIALLGYGKMGKLVESLALLRNDEVVLRLDEQTNGGFEGITEENFRTVDVAIDFSSPDAVPESARRVAALGVNLVIGTTGWTSKLGEVKALADRYDVGILWSPNFSVGVNVFFKVVAEAARLLRNQPGYEAWAYEIHHSAKKDAPSGTLLKLVDEMKGAGYRGSIDTSSNRAGMHPGTHEIGFDSASDTITLKHCARNREGFAAGALLAAHWLDGKKGFYDFSDAIFAGE